MEHLLEQIMLIVGFFGSILALIIFIENQRSIARLDATKEDRPEPIKEKCSFCGKEK